MSRDGDDVAVVFNVGLKPRLLLFHGESEHPYVTKDLSRYVSDVTWNRASDEVAVLFSGYVDDGLRCRAFDPRARLTLPDVTLFDAQTGVARLSFFSGGPEAKLAFSAGGRLIYAISQSRALMYSWGDWVKDTLKVFSASDATLVRTLRVSRSGVRNSFVVSPDGRLIAADSSTHLFGFLREPDFVHKMGRFVILNSETGESLFEYHASMDGQIQFPIRFAFSPDGKLLFVDFNGEGVVVYSVGGQKPGV